MPKSKNYNSKSTTEKQNYQFVSKNDHSITFKGGKDSFTKKEKESLNTVIKSPNLLKVLLASLAISTMSIGAATGSSSMNKDRDLQKNYETTTEMTTQFQNRQLTPDEWLGRWNQAWNLCYKALGPEKPVYNTFDPNADFMSQGIQQVQPHNDAEVYEVMKAKFPNLCSYLNSPVHRAKLQEQYRKAAEAFQQLYLQMQQNEQRRQQNTELRLQELQQRQILQQQRDLYFERERALIRLGGEINRIVDQ